jgi:hypothetical protein
MSYLSDQNLAHLQGADQYVIKETIAALVWQWYETHKEDTVVRKKILFFSLDVQVKDMKFIFTAIFGSSPYGV